MGWVRIATDSIADLPATLVSEMDITVVPCQVFWGEEVYRDGVDLKPHQFYERLAVSSELPRPKDHTPTSPIAHAEIFGPSGPFKSVNACVFSEPADCYFVTTRAFGRSFYRNRVHAEHDALASECLGAVSNYLRVLDGQRVH